MNEISGDADRQPEIGGSRFDSGACRARRRCIRSSNRSCRRNARCNRSWRSATRRSPPIRKSAGWPFKDMTMLTLAIAATGMSAQEQKPGGHRQQYRQYQHDGIQALARRIHRPHVSVGTTDGRLQPRPRRHDPRRRAARPRRAHRRDTQPEHPGIADQYRQYARSRHQRARLVSGDDARRHHRLYARRRFQHQRHRPTGDDRRLSGHAADPDTDQFDQYHGQPDRPGDGDAFPARCSRKRSAN